MGGACSPEVPNQPHSLMPQLVLITPMDHLMYLLSVWRLSVVLDQNIYGILCKFSQQYFWLEVTLMFWRVVQQNARNTCMFGEKVALTYS